MKFYHRYVCPGTNIYIAFGVLWFQACSGSLGTCPPQLRVDCWAGVSFSFHQLLPRSWLAPPAPNHHLPVQMVRVRSWWIPWFPACPPGSPHRHPGIGSCHPIWNPSGIQSSHHFPGDRIPSCGQQCLVGLRPVQPLLCLRALHQPPWVWFQFLVYILSHDTLLALTGTIQLAWLMTI